MSTRVEIASWGSLKVTKYLVASSGGNDSNDSTVKATRDFLLPVPVLKSLIALAVGRPANEGTLKIRRSA